MLALCRGSCPRLALCTRPFSTTPNPVKRYVVGLGNDAEEFRGTRHNIGFAVIDALVAQLGLQPQSVRIVDGLLADTRYLLVPWSARKQPAVQKMGRSPRSRRHEHDSG